jgi:hypothetical protein
MIGSITVRVLPTHGNIPEKKLSSDSEGALVICTLEWNKAVQFMVQINLRRVILNV